MATKRNYKKEYENYQGTPEQIENRSQRNKARREYEKAHGNLPSSVDVGHKKAVIAGGSNAPTNLRAESPKANRNWRKGKKGSRSYEP